MKLASVKNSGLNITDIYSHSLFNLFVVPGGIVDFIATILKVGDKVILPTQGFTKLPYNGEDYYVGPENQILAKITEATSLDDLLGETKENLTKEEIKDLTNE